MRRTEQKHTNSEKFWALRTLRKTCNTWRMTYDRLKVSTYLHMYTYVLLYELWWRICYSLLPDDVTTDSAPNICNRTTSYCTCIAIKHHPCQPNQLTLMVARISGYWTSPYVHVFIFCSSMNESFLQKLFFFLIFWPDTEGGQWHFLC